MKTRQETWRQPVYILGFGLILLVTEVAGLKYAGIGFAVSGMAIEATGAFAASKSDQQIELALLCGALIGLIGSVIGTVLCLKFAFPMVATMLSITLLVLLVAFGVGARFEKA